MNRVLFPYQGNYQGIRLPTIPITLIHSRQKLSTTALVDSGAMISIFKPEIAKSLGIKIEDGKKIQLSGISGQIKGYIHKTTLEVAGLRITTQIVFSKQSPTPINLLGRVSFFENFDITFEEKKKQVILSY